MASRSPPAEGPRMGVGGCASGGTGESRGGFREAPPKGAAAAVGLARLARIFAPFLAKHAGYERRSWLPALSLSKGPPGADVGRIFTTLFLYRTDFSQSSQQHLHHI